MGIVQRFKNAYKALRYEAVEPSPTRRVVYVSTKSEDQELTPQKRKALVSESRDQQRNFTLAGFALRKHLQFVSYYRFSAETPNREFNRALERRLDAWKRRENCDGARRSTFDELLTLVESHRAVDGDVGILRRSDGRIQIVEGDRIKNPPEDRLTQADRYEVTFVKWEKGNFTLFVIQGDKWSELLQQFPAIGHSVIRGLVTYRLMVRRELYHLTSWIMFSHAHMVAS